MNVVSLWWLLIVVLKVIGFTNANWITGNLCWSMPCMNGGSCFGSAYTYLCICPIDYNGALCEKRRGVCQENPCGNRGLCVETSLTSFQCRCYFGYVGPTCGEYVSRNNSNIWSSLLPVHTRILFDMLQEAYHTKKLKGKSSIDVTNNQIDFLGLLTTNEPTVDTSMPETLMNTLITPQTETIGTDHIISAEHIQLEKIFSDVTTVSTLHTNTNEFTEDVDYTTTFSLSSETDMTSMSVNIENITTTTIIEQREYTFLNTTEDQEIVNITEQLFTSTPAQWSNDINTTDVQDLSEETTISFNSDVFTTTELIAFPSDHMNISIDNDTYYSIDQTITSPNYSSNQSVNINTTAISQTVHSRLLYNLCQQVLSHIFPNTSSSSSADVATALSLASNSSYVNNNTADAFLSWLRKRFSSSTVSSLSINEIPSSTIPLKRVDMDDILHQMNNNVNSEQ